MNQYLQDFARQFIKDGLAELKDGNRLLFKRMYGHKDLDAAVDDVVDSMPADKLDCAMMQVDRTVKKIRVTEVV